MADPQNDGVENGVRVIGPMHHRRNKLLQGKLLDVELSIRGILRGYGLKVGEVKPRLLGISKRGNTYLRTLLIHGARAALPSLSQSDTLLGRWLKAMIDRGVHRNAVVVALANKLARIAWAVLRKNATFERSYPEAV